MIKTLMLYKTLCKEVQVIGLEVLSLKGTLPDDKEKMMSMLKRAMEDTGMLKDERFRML